ncbi:reverse transcriptase domain-containing protein [Tanacetum coccineum]
MPSLSPNSLADNFELKYGLLNLVQNKQFFGHDKEDPHDLVRYFKTDTSTIEVPEVPRRNRYNQNRGNFNQASAYQPPVQQGQIYRPQVVQPPAYQAPAYQAPAPQIQGVSKEDFQAYVKANDAVMRNMQTQGQNMQNQLTNLTDMLSKFVTSNTASTSGTLPSNTVTNPKEDLKGITTRSGVAYKGPTIPITSSPKVMERETEVTKDTMPPANNGSTKDVPPPVVPVVHHESISELVNAPVSASMPNQKASIPFPSRRNDERNREKANEQIEKFYKIFQDLSFEISFTDALMLMPKFASTLKTLIGNKEKLSEMARTPLNENCSAVILNKLPKKLGDPGRFLIPCEFSGINTCNALADLGASINLMPYSVWKNLSLPELTPTCMTLELADRSISEPIGIAEDVYVTVGKFQFPADFVVVDFEPDPRVPLILGRSFLKTSRALIDVYEGEITLRVGREAITFNLDQTSRYTANYNHMTANRIDVIDMACEEYSQEVLGFSNVISSGNPTPYYDPIVSTSSPTLTPFGDSDFLLFEEADSFLAIEDDPTSPEVDPTYYDPDGDILLLEAILNSDPSPPPPNQGNYFPETRKDLKICEANNEKSSVNEPPEVELKDLPPHLEYAFLEGNDKLPVIIAKDLKNEEKAALIEVLKSHKRAIAWKLSDIKGINPEFCTHKILMEEDYEPTVQHQRRVNKARVTMSSATSDVTYTSVYTDSEPGRAFWGADYEEISEGGIPRVIVLGYDGLPLQPVAPPSPDYVLGPENLQILPVPQDEDEREPMFIQAHDPDYVPEPIYPEYIPLEDDHEFPAEEQPLPPIDSPTTDSPGYVTESDPEEDPEEYEDDKTEDGPVDYPMDGGDDGDDDDGDSSGDDARDEDEDEEDEEDEEEEEHLAPADSTVIPADEPVFPPEGTEPIIPPPSTDITIGARWYVLNYTYHFPL